MFIDELTMVRNHYLVKNVERGLPRRILWQLNKKRSILRKKTFQHDELERAFNEIFKFKHHKMIYAGLRPFQWDECAKSFTAITPLKVHMKTHSGLA